MTVVATGLATGSGNRFDITGENGALLVRQYTPGTYTYSKNQFASPIKAIAGVAYNSSGVTLSIDIT